MKLLSSIHFLGRVKQTVQPTTGKVVRLEQKEKPTFSLDVTLFLSPVLAKASGKYYFFL